MAFVSIVADWSALASDLWFGASGGCYLGCIQTVGRRFRARDREDAWLGDYPSLATARSIIEHDMRV